MHRPALFLERIYHAIVHYEHDSNATLAVAEARSEIVHCLRPV